MMWDCGIISNHWWDAGRMGYGTWILLLVLGGGLFLFSDSNNANAQMMGGHGWTPAAQTSVQGQAWRGHDPGYGRGHYGTTHGNAKVNTAAGYHNGHGPHGGSYGGCGW